MDDKEKLLRKEMQILRLKMKILKMDKERTEEKMGDYKGELEILLAIVAVGLVVYFITSTVGMIMQEVENEYRILHQEY